MSKLKFLVLSALAIPSVHAENWPVWRGPRGDGTSFETNVPVHWDATSNVVWKTQIPGLGHASPIVFGRQVFTVTALPDTQERVLLCLDRQDGSVQWQQTVLKSPLERKHTLNSHASSTPATDGHSVFVSFLDRQEMFVAAYDLMGHLQWSLRPGEFKSQHGFCSSPLLYEDKVILNGDHDGDSYLVALSRKDGHTLWKTPRENHTRSYCAPLIRELDGRVQMVLSGDKCVASYNPNNGSRYWVIDGPTEQFVASPVYSVKEDLLFITGGFPDHHILAIKPNGQGNVSKTHIVWRTNKGVAYVPSPIIEGDYFLVVSDSGVAHCYEAKSGRLAWQQRLGEHHASLVSARGLVYFLSDEGVTTVVHPASEYRCVATNALGERCFASPAISEGQIFIRSDQHLFCIGAQSTNESQLR